MLNKILSKKACSNCRLCCIFDLYDLWETPVFSADMCRKITAARPGTAFISCEGGFVFKPDKLSDEQTFTCPALSENGCILGDEKPFVCRIFPYRIMSLGNRQVIALASDCKELFERPLSQLTGLLKEGLADEIFTYADSHPEIIKPYYEGYPVLLLR